MGTSGRECNKTSSGEDGCEHLCCGRGYDTRRVTRVENCNCKFHWCCEIICHNCTRKLDIHTCKPEVETTDTASEATSNATSSSTNRGNKKRNRKRWCKRRKKRGKKCTKKQKLNKRNKRSIQTNNSFEKNVDFKQKPFKKFHREENKDNKIDKTNKKSIFSSTSNQKLFLHSNRYNQRTKKASYFWSAYSAMWQKVNFLIFRKT